jgi:hypothetical protein
MPPGARGGTVSCHLRRIWLARQRCTGEGRSPGAARRRPPASGEGQPGRRSWKSASPLACTVKGCRICHPACWARRTIPSGTGEPAGAVGVRAGITRAEAGNVAAATTTENYGGVPGVMRTSGTPGKAPCGAAESAPRRWMVRPLGEEDGGMERFTSAAFSFEVTDTPRPAGTGRKASPSSCTAFRRTAVAGTG